MSSNNKPKIAFFDFTSCEGCQLTVIDSLQNDINLLDAVDIAEFREAMSEKGGDYQIAFVEGACTRPEDENRLKTIRSQAKFLFALGACAHLGGVNALRNWQAAQDVKKYVYGEMGQLFSSYPVRPIDAVISIDGFIPGCPIDRNEFLRVVKSLLIGYQPLIPDYPVCVECKLKENRCLFKEGKICLGPITRAGCMAICPKFNLGCRGCRGWITNPNFEGLRVALEEHKIKEDEFAEKSMFFQSYFIIQEEMGIYDKSEK